MAWLLERTVNKLVRGHRVKTLYKNHDFLEAYAKHTDLRVSEDPKEAIGGLWEEIGHLQFSFLRDEGLAPSNSMLDIGCGTLRGGRHFIRYLNEGRYTGIEMSEKAIEAAQNLLREESLTGKAPVLVRNPDGNMSFAKLEGVSFDYILAHSVFTHLMKVHIEECLSNIHRVMGRFSRFYFTYFEAGGYEQRAEKDFAYPFAYFEGVAAENGLRIEDLSSRYPHPRNQKMALVTLV
jgi:SAM-dependent methyltransferase